MREQMINASEQSEKINADLFPPVLRSLAKTLGLGCAIDLVSAHGGIQFYIPYKFKSDHQIVKTIGVEGAAKLAASYGGEIIKLPMSDKVFMQLKHCLVQTLLASGCTKKEIARELGYSERRIQQLCEEAGMVDDKTTDLFGDK